MKRMILMSFSNAHIAKIDSMIQDLLSVATHFDSVTSKSPRNSSSTTSLPSSRNQSPTVLVSDTSRPQLNSSAAIEFISHTFRLCSTSIDVFGQKLILYS